MDLLIRYEHPLTAGLSLDILCPLKSVEELPFVNVGLRPLPTHLATFGSSLSYRYVRGGLLSLCNTGPLAVKRQIVCIHDVNTRLASESYGFMFRAAYRLLQPALGGALRRSSRSHFLAETMAQFRCCVGG